MNIAQQQSKRLFFLQKASASPSAHNVIFLHGLLGNHRNLFCLFPYIHSKANSYFLDFRNHGQSFHSDQDSISDHVQDLNEFIKSEVGGKCTLIGHSFGGKVAMEYALKHQKDVESLVVMDISPAKIISDPQRPTTTVKYLTALNQIDLERDKALIDQDILSIAQTKALFEFFSSNLVKVDEKFRWRCNLPVLAKSILSNLSFEYTQAKSEIPTTVIFGTKSEYQVWKDREVFEKYFGKVEMSGVEAFHWIHAERPKDVGKLVEKHLAYLVDK